MKWLVTGASGFLGANAGRFLGRKGVDTIGLTRNATAAGFNSTTHAGLEHPGELTTAIRASAPDVILHCAAMSSHAECEQNPDLATRINAEATRELAQVARETNARLIYICTDSVFSGTRGNYSELDHTDPFSVYGTTKLLGEQYAQQETEPLIIRTNFFGWSPTKIRSILEFFHTNLENHNPIQGFTNITTTSLYTHTLLDYIWQLADGSHTGIFHVTSRDSLTKFEFGQQVAQVWNFDSSNLTPTQSDQPRDISLSTVKLAATLGTQIQSQVEGIELARQDLGDFRSSTRQLDQTDPKHKPR